jgi:lipid-A-disaccharide synthase
VLPVAPTLDQEFVRSYVDQSGVSVRMVDGRVYDALRAADAAIVASGTATLETGLMGVPMAIVYRVSALNYFILTKLARGVKNVGLVNIVAGRRIVPELVQKDSTPEKMADSIAALLDDPVHAQRVRNDLIDIRARLGDAGASLRAAQVVGELLAGAGRAEDHGNL